MNLIPYDDRFQTCPACGAGPRYDKEIRFCLADCAALVASGKWMNVSTQGSKSVPHLHRTCTLCGFEQLTTTASNLQSP